MGGVIVVVDTIDVRVRRGHPDPWPIEVMRDTLNTDDTFQFVFAYEMLVLLNEREDVVLRLQNLDPDDPAIVQRVVYFKRLDESLTDLNGERAHEYVIPTRVGSFLVACLQCYFNLSWKQKAILPFPTVIYMYVKTPQTIFSTYCFKGKMSQLFVPNTRRHNLK